MLPAGRELDTLVRDVIFGPWDESRCRVCGWKIVPDGESGCWKDNCSMRFPDGMYPPRADEPRPYSTDIAAAWEVVEKLQSDWAATIENDGVGWWEATFWAGDTSHTMAAGAAPLAICWAAVLAAGDAAVKQS